MLQTFKCKYLKEIIVKYFKINVTIMHIACPYVIYDYY